MLTTTERAQETSQHYETRPSRLGPILLATDGTESSDAALRAASAIAAHSNAAVVVLAVLEGLPLVAADFGMAIPPVESTDTRRQALAERVRDQLNGFGPSARDWTVEIREGDPAATIARTAKDLDARVIVTGLGHHDLVNRIFGNEIALRTLRLARTPVLAVPPGFVTMPTRVVVATDFSAASVAAARTAFEIIDTATNVYLIHVSPRLELKAEAFAAWTTMFSEGLPPAFERVKAEIGLPPYTTVETVSRIGKASREVLEFAESVQADLIVTGSRGAGLINRLLIGSTATGIVRGARCAVLAVPAAPSEDRLVWPASGEHLKFHRDEWADELAAFTRRNVGRRASLEVDDPELGAQSQERDYPFLGASWDRHDERVEIMVGDFEGAGRHLTRGIAGVTGIDLLRDESGRDGVLRVAHHPGQTILTLSR
jgi:nucleotide-binding universal stress UspA family protein